MHRVEQPESHGGGRGGCGGVYATKPRPAFHPALRPAVSGCGARGTLVRHAPHRSAHNGIAHSVWFVAVGRDLEAWSSSDQDDGASSSEEQCDGIHGDDLAVKLGLDIPQLDLGFEANDKPVEYATPPSTTVAAKPTDAQLLNSHGVFDANNFRDTLPNERGRGAFVGGLLGLLEHGRIATNYLNADRGSDSQHRWSLNRLPGCTDRLLRFINIMLVEVIGLKPFVTWRSLARCLGDTRSYLSPKHWSCLELKGGGKMASSRSPWQSYKTQKGHFDQLREELVQWLLWCDGDRQCSSPASWDPCGKGAALAVRRVQTLGGAGSSCCNEKALAAVVQTAWTRAEQEHAVDNSVSDCASGTSRPSGSDNSRAGGSSKKSGARVNPTDGARPQAGGRKMKRSKHSE